MPERTTGRCTPAGTKQNLNIMQTTQLPKTVQEFYKEAITLDINYGYKPGAQLPPQVRSYLIKHVLVIARKMCFTIEEDIFILVSAVSVRKVFWIFWDLQGKHFVAVTSKEYDVTQFVAIVVDKDSLMQLLKMYYKPDVFNYRMVAGTVRFRPR